MIFRSGVRKPLFFQWFRPPNIENPFVFQCFQGPNLKTNCFSMIFRRKLEKHNVFQLFVVFRTDFWNFTKSGKMGGDLKAVGRNKNPYEKVGKIADPEKSVFPDPKTNENTMFFNPALEIVENHCFFNGFRP